MATKTLLFVALCAILGAISAQGLSRVSGWYNGKYYDYSKYRNGLPDRYYDDDMGLDRVSGWYNGKYYDYSKYRNGVPDRYYDDDMDSFKLKKLGKLAKKGLKAYNTYKKYRGMIPMDDDERIGAPCFCVRAPCPCANNFGFDDDMDALKLKKLGKKLGKVAKKGLKAYQTYQKYRGMIPVDDDMDEFKLKKLGKIAKKGLKAYNTYKKYRGMIPMDDDIVDEFDPELSVTASYNNGPWSVSGTHDFQTNNGNIQGNYNQGPWNIGMQHNWDDDMGLDRVSGWYNGKYYDYSKYRNGLPDRYYDDDMDSFKLKKLGKLAKKGLKAYQTYQKYRGMIPVDDDERRFGGFY